MLTHVVINDDICKQIFSVDDQNRRTLCSLTELVNVGVLAIRSGKTIEWDSAAMRVKDAPEFDSWIKEPARAGWSYGEDLWQG